MDAASHEEWPVERLARVSGVSEAHFARSFKEAFGVPPHRYLLTRRIERAKALLRDTDLPITEIAFQTGWKSLGTFGRIFRDITGESPGELRAARAGRARTSSSACRPASSAPPTGPTSRSQFRRSGARRRAVQNKRQQKRRSHESRYRSCRAVRSRSGRSARVLRRQARISRPHRRAATATIAGSRCSTRTSRRSSSACSSRGRRCSTRRPRRR